MSYKWWASTPTLQVTYDNVLLTTNQQLLIASTRHAEVLRSIWLIRANGPDASEYLSMTALENHRISRLNSSIARSSKSFANSSLFWLGSVSLVPSRQSKT